MPTYANLLTFVYERFNARDIDAVLSAMEKDVDWPNGMDGGRVRGHGEVRAYWERQWSLVNPHVHPVGFTEEAPGYTNVRVHQTVRDLGGRVILDRMVEHVYFIQNGLIRSMEIREIDESQKSS